jgi:WD40 repeat protein
VVIEGKSFLITSGIDNKIKIWNTEVEKDRKNYYIKTLKGHTSSVLNVRYCSSKDFLISSSCDKTLRIWKLEKVDKEKVPYFKIQQIIKAN